MRAKSVAFKRGIDSKEALRVGLPGLNEFKKFMESKGYGEFAQQEVDDSTRKTVATFLPKRDDGTRDYQSSVYFEVYINQSDRILRVNYEDDVKDFRDFILSSVLKRVRRNLMPMGHFKDR